MQFASHIAVLVHRSSTREQLHVFPAVSACGRVWNLEQAAVSFPQWGARRA